MPATGHYFLNEGEDPDQNALYEKYRLTSQHGPLLLMLLLLVATACIALAAIIFSEQVSGSPRCTSPAFHPLFGGWPLPPVQAAKKQVFGLIYYSNRGWVFR